MFDHSIKVPRLYKTACKIAKEVSEGKGSIKQLVYECKHPNIKALYALVVHTFQRTDEIEGLLRKSKLLVKEPRFDPWLAKVLITELLWGKKRLASQAKPVTTILAYEQIFKAHLSDASAKHFEDVEQVDKPRYVRINTLKVSINEAIEGFRDEGWVLKRHTDCKEYLDFLETVQNLGSEEFMVDFHIPYLLIFPPKTHFYQHQAYKKGNIILQDKASCLPVHILNPEPESTVLDMCAAPGMKTTQCAAIMENKGNIYAVEIGKKRYETLKKIIESSGATCINAINADVLTLTGKDYPDVEYILVDPSCSGSGITDRVEIGQQEMDQHKNRIDKLAGFQIKILRHALTKFPKVKRVVYSTCSVYPEENEDVVRQVLETCLYFKLVPANEFIKNQWSNFGSSDFGDLGNFCLYAKPDIDLTSGFFVAVFERLEEGEKNQFLNENLYLQKMQEYRDRKNKESMEVKTEPTDEKNRKKQKNKNIEERPRFDTECVDRTVNGSTIEIKKEFGESLPEQQGPNTEISEKRKKKKKIKIEVESDEIKIEEEVGENLEKAQGLNVETSEKKKKRRKIKSEEDNEERVSHLEENGVLVEELVPKKKKKKKHDESVCNNRIEEVDLKDGVISRKKIGKGEEHIDTNEDETEKFKIKDEPKQKKKKYKTDKSQNSEEVGAEKDVKPKKEKNKKTKNEPNEMDNAFKSEEENRRKKKKKKKINESLSENGINYNIGSNEENTSKIGEESVDENILPKKKNKKDKKTRNVRVLETGFEIGEKETQKKKKTKAPVDV